MSRWVRAVLILAAVLIIGAAAVLLYTGIPFGGAGRLLSEGGVQELRDELRPSREGAPRVLIFALDGVGDGEFRRAIAGGRLPRVASFLGADDVQSETWRHAFAPTGALSILPSTTYAAWTATFTGEPVAISGVPGNEWFDRETMTFVAPAPVSVSGYGDAVRVYAENLLGDWIAPPTLFERADVRSYASLLAQHRGADVLIQPHPGLLGDVVASVAAGVAEEDEIGPEAYSTLDRESVAELLSLIEREGLADLTVVYFPGVDLYTHVAEPALAEQVDYLADVLDPLIDSVLTAFDVRAALEETYVVFVSDHGHTPALDQDRNALGTGGSDEWPAVLDSLGFRVRPFEAETSDSTFQAVFAYQGAFAYLHLADRSTCPDPDRRCDWRRPPRFEEDVLEVVRSIDFVNRTGESIPQLRGTLDLIFAREPRGVGDARPFQVWDGSRLVPVADYLAASPRPDLIELEARLEAMATGRFGHRTGDVLLLSRYRSEDPIENRFYFSKEYRSWHGSPSRQDSEIVWIVARKGQSGDRIGNVVREAIGDRPDQLDVMPLVLHLLGANDGD